MRSRALMLSLAVLVGGQAGLAQEPPSAPKADDAIEPALMRMVNQLSVGYRLRLEEIPGNDQPDRLLPVFFRIMRQGQPNARFAVAQLLGEVHDAVASLILMERVVAETNPEVLGAIARSIEKQRDSAPARTTQQVVQNPFTPAEVDELLGRVRFRQDQYACEVLIPFDRTWPRYHATVNHTLDVLNGLGASRASVREPCPEPDDRESRPRRTEAPPRAPVTLRAARGPIADALRADEAVAAGTRFLTDPGFQRPDVPQAPTPSPLPVASAATRAPVGLTGAAAQLAAVAIGEEDPGLALLASPPPGLPQPPVTGKKKHKKGKRGLVEVKPGDLLTGPVNGGISPLPAADAVPVPVSVGAGDDPVLGATSLRLRRRRRPRSATGPASASSGPVSLPEPINRSYTGPHAAQDSTADAKALADRIESTVARDAGLNFGQLASQYPPEVVVTALGRILALGGTVAKFRAARLLGQAPGFIPVLILMAELPNQSVHSTTCDGILHALKHYGARDPYHPIAEGRFLNLLEDIVAQRPRGVASYLLPLVGAYPQFEVPIIRALARMEVKEAIEPIRSMVGHSEALDAEAVGALGLLGADYELNRDRLARALPRAAEQGKKGLAPAHSILFYLEHMALKRRDPQAVKPMFYVVPHAAEPFRTHTMAILHRVSIRDPETFVTGLSLISSADQEEFIHDLVAYLYQKDYDKQFLDVWHKSFRDLDLGFDHPDLVARIEKMVKSKIP